MRRATVLIMVAFLGEAGGWAYLTTGKMKPVFVWTGVDSRIDRERFVLCRSQEDIESLWKEHTRCEDGNARCFCPEVDFDSFMIIGIFAGKGAPLGISVESASEEKSYLRLRYRINTAQSAGVAANRRNGAGPKEPRGYVLAVLPRSGKTIVVEQDAERGLNEPPVWKERARLAGPGKE